MGPTDGDDISSHRPAVPLLEGHRPAVSVSEHRPAVSAQALVPGEAADNSAHRLVVSDQALVPGEAADISEPALGRTTLEDGGVLSLETSPAPGGATLSGPTCTTT